MNETEAQAALERVRGALLEIGIEPDAVYLYGGRGFFNPAKISSEMAWRACEVARVGTPLCWACYCHARMCHHIRWGREYCAATVRLTLDCGTHRDEHLDIGPADTGSLRPSSGGGT